MDFSDQMKQKAHDVDLQAKAKDFGDALAEVVKAAFDAAADYAQANREKVDGALDKAEQVIGERTGGTHDETVGKVRSQLDKGMDKLAEHGARPPQHEVPDDRHSAFDDDPPAGSPS
ncbi:MAG: antitoxin [Micrococcales bacterium]|nr:antitoxin [Micrococcales bacterium]